MIIAPYVRSVGFVFAHHHTLFDDSECPLDYELSLLLKSLSYVQVLYDDVDDDDSGWGGGGGGGSGGGGGGGWSNDNNKCYTV